MSTVIVSNSAALVSALKVAQSGDVIKLAAGDYAGFTLKDMHFSGAGVTITSADAANEAKLNGFLIVASDGINIQNVEMVVNVAVANPFQVLSSSRVHFDNLNVHGSLDDNAQNDGAGLLIRASKDVVVSNSEFQQLQFGVSHVDDQNITIAGNQFHDIRTDAIRGGGTSQITIKNNYFTDFDPKTGDHADAIQFWSRNTTTSATDITITGNVIVRGEGGVLQGVFMRDEVGTLPFKNVTISDNLVVGSMYNGIFIAGAQGVTVTNNVVAGLPDQAAWIGIQRVSGATLTNNQATSYNITTAVTNLVRSGDTVIGASFDGGRAVQASYFAAHDTAKGGAAVLAPVTLAELDAQALATWNAMEAIRMNTKTVTGTDGVDVLGTDASRNTLIEAGGGNDNISASGLGHNTLVGGAGDDAYRVFTGHNTIVEVVGGGYDQVLAYVDFVLPDNVERLQLAGDAHEGVGNALNNKMIGGAGGDTLSGLGGDDAIEPMDGADFVAGGEGNDVVFGGAGADTLVGDAGNDMLRGDAGNDSLVGGEGADTVDGSAGADVLSGGAGADMFSFSNVEAKGEEVVDFSRAQGDRISLAGIDANVNLSADQKFAFIGTGAFTKTAGQLRYEVSGGDSYLSGDVNGDGAADFSILMRGVNSFQSSDFIL